MITESIILLSIIVYVKIRYEMYCKLIIYYKLIFTMLYENIYQ